MHKLLSKASSVNELAKPCSFICPRCSRCCWESSEAEKNLITTFKVFVLSFVVKEEGTKLKENGNASGCLNAAILDAIVYCRLKTVNERPPAATFLRKTKSMVLNWIPIRVKSVQISYKGSYSRFSRCEYAATSSQMHFTLPVMGKIKHKRLLKLKCYSSLVLVHESLPFHLLDT